MAIQPQTQIRRQRVSLYEFAPGCTADPNRAWNDRIKLDFRCGQVEVENNASLLLHLRSIYAGGDGCITSPSRKTGSKRITFKLVKEEALFGAQFALWPANRKILGRRGLAELWNMHITLEVNPTRIFSHFGCRIKALHALRRGCFPIFDETRDQLIRDETLDDNNNYYRDADVRLAVNANNQSINKHAIRACMAFVEQSLRPRKRTTDEVDLDDPWSGGPYREIHFDCNWDHWAISQLETIWEYDCDDAVSTVHALSRNASEISSGLGETFYAMDKTKTGSPTIQRPENAISLTIPLGQKNTKLVIYAKSPHRVRCEVRHLKNPRTIYSRYDHIKNLTTDRLENLFAMITEINNLSASNRANPFLQELWRRHPRSVGTVLQLTIFLKLIASVCGGNEVDMLRILPPLIANGRLSGKGSESYRSAIRQLVLHGVISSTTSRSRASGRVYAIARPYADVLDQLKTNMRQGWPHYYGD